MSNFLIVALGGALGAMARYGTSLTVIRLVESRAPLATWTANLVGCLLIGFLAPLADRLPLGETARLLLFVGFLGSYTTFSTFSLDSVMLWREGQMGLLLLNAAGSVAAGMLLVWVGMKLSQALLGA
ncbi:MAG: fluoride efflux transporter CrcB [Rhodothermales bacterium]